MVRAQDLNLQIGTKLFGNHSNPRFPSSSISLSSKSYVNIIFHRAKHNDLQRRDSSPFKHLFTMRFTLAPETYFVKRNLIFPVK